MFHDCRERPRENRRMNIVTFTEVDAPTILTLLPQTATKENRDAMLRSGTEVGMQEQMDLPGQLVASLR